MKVDPIFKIMCCTLSLGFFGGAKILRAQPFAGGSLSTHARQSFPLKHKNTVLPISHEMKKCYERWAKNRTLSPEKKAFSFKIFLYTMEENKKILRARSLVMTLSQKSSSSLTERETQFLTRLFEHYRVRSIPALLERMDVIPSSLALAQAIIESAWGNSRLAKNKNAYFGMIRKTSCAEYFKYSDIRQSVIAYMDNLNKHKAYDRLRKLRKQERCKGKGIEGISLAQGLGSYCTGGQYPKQIRNVIQKLCLGNLDTALSPVSF